MSSLSETFIRIAGFSEESVVDGPGLRFVLFTQGCHRHCPGCHNPQTWDFENGRDICAKEILDKISANPLLHGVTFSGGEPFAQAEALAVLAAELKEANYHLMAYSGYTIEELHNRPECKNLLSNLDLLVDGPFIEEEKSLELLYKGSRNQRIINIQETIKNNWIPVIDPMDVPPSH